MNEVHLVPLRLRAAYLAMHRSTNECLGSLDITADQFVCLLLLLEHGTVIQRELAALAGSDANTMSAVIALLERKGLVVRTPHKVDRRARVVSLTPAGRTTTRRASTRLKRIHKRLLGEFSGEEAGQLASSLHRLSTALS
jgi:DNA-binding MarR family transcriptional regulator